jgi:integrase
MSLNKAEIGVTILAEQVGHSLPAFTLERYSHLMKNDKMEAAIKYDKMMSEIIAG